MLTNKTMYEAFRNDDDESKKTRVCKDEMNEQEYLENNPAAP